MSICYDCKRPTGRPTSARRCFPCFEKHVSKRDPRGQLLAHVIFTMAKARGEIESASRFACVDWGKRAVEYDHGDYNEPLLVEPVCRRCNIIRRGAAPMDIKTFFAKWSRGDTGFMRKPNFEAFRKARR